MNTVFRIQLDNATDSPAARSFIPRRRHKKSRGGCTACKRLRIKCNEVKPRCGKCIKTGDECVYPALTASSPEPSSAGDQSLVASPHPDMYSMSVDLLETDLSHFLAASPGPVHSNQVVCSVRMLQHFQATTSLTIGSPASRDVMHSFVAKEAWSYPHLMHMTLAVSAAHLKRLHMNASQPDLHHQYSVAEATHWDKALPLHRTAITKAKPDFDATLAATFLSIVLAFSLDDQVPLDAYTGDDEAVFLSAIEPISSTMGFRALMHCLDENFDRSVWKGVLLTSDDAFKTFSDGSAPGISGLPPLFVDLCEMDDSSTNENNRYHFILRLLAPLLRTKIGLDTFSTLMAFQGRTWPHLRPLVLRRDPIGLLILSYWFALMAQLNQWWMQKRAYSECMALVHYLLPLKDPKITALLPFPASFGQVDLSYIWDPSITTTESPRMLQQYFDPDLTLSTAHLPSTLTLLQTSTSDRDASR